MTLETDPIALRKLVLARRLYQHGLRQPTDSSDIGRIVAVISFDLAAETAMKAAVSALETAKAPSDTFTGLVQQTNQAMTAAGLPDLPNRAQLLYVHGIRNEAQHRGR